ncbi:MAG: class I SAM-dependent methyltransferase [Ignavibacteriales bacterium]|nr:class I SAM-dependent methyltransferase [Ignavibacteriales bacterium]
MNGFQLVIAPSVLHPRIFKSGRVFADFLLTINLKGKRVLDMGTGSGILALTAAARGAAVTATDVNTTAAQCARDNFQRNGFGGAITTTEGYLFKPLINRDFDIIVFNPPYLTRKPDTHELALYGGDQLALLREFAFSAHGHLKPEGFILLIVSTDSNMDMVLNIFREQNYRPIPVHKVKTLFEDFFVFKFIPEERANNDIGLICPSCHKNLERAENGWACMNESLTFGLVDGIPDFLLPSRRYEVGQFLDIYQAVRKSEGWGSDNAEYYLSLPYSDMSGKHKANWQIRSKTFETFIKAFSEENTGPKTILDLGAGNCWLSLRLAELGHKVFGVDINTDSKDGIGVVQRIDDFRARQLTCIRAEFKYLPFADQTFDTIIFNASLHYAAHPYETIAHAMPLLKTAGSMFILDSPIYTHLASGQMMLTERIRSIESNLRISINEEQAGSFLTFEGLNRLKENYHVDYLVPQYGVKWNLRPLVARVLGKRQPASFAIIRIRVPEHQ